MILHWIFFCTLYSLDLQSLSDLFDSWQGTRDFAKEQMTVREKALISIIQDVFKRHGATTALDTPVFELRERGTLFGSKLIYVIADQVKLISTCG